MYRLAALRAARRSRPDCDSASAVDRLSQGIRFFTIYGLVPSRSPPNLMAAELKQRFLFPLPPSERGAPIGQAPPVRFVRAAARVTGHNPTVEITSFGGTCLRLKGREGVVAADAYASVVGPTGRGLTADIVTYSHPDRQQSLALDTPAGHARGEGIKVPSSLTSAFLLDGPGEYEVHGVLINGVRTFRDDQKGAARGANTCFVYELDGLHAAHLGDIGHSLNEDALGEIGAVDVVCLPLGGALSASKAAELVAQLEAKLVVPMSANGSFEPELDRFLHEMGVQRSEPIARLAVTISSLPQETAIVILEPRGRS
jgi:hypothetical protein